MQSSICNLLLRRGPVRPCAFRLFARPTFRLNLEGRDPASITPAQAAGVREALEELFGTPNQPRIPAEAGLRIDLLQAAAGPVSSDAEGNQFGLYRRHCVACHGISGDGAGPSAAVLSPYPRDFRDGVFKYTSTRGGAKPVRENLARTLRNGIPGTAMPSQAKLPQAEIESLIEYVQYLSIRGQTELYLIAEAVDEDASRPLDLQAARAEGVAPAADSWRAAKKFKVLPPAPPPTATSEERAALLARGREAFARKASRCVDCHGPEGRGDGPQAGALYDDWNKRKLPATPAETRLLAGRFLLPIQSLRPRNFRKGIFHGGDRDIDLYLRIDLGIKGTPMPAFGPTPDSPGLLGPEDIGSLVYYIRSLSK